MKSVVLLVSLIFTQLAWAKSHVGVALTTVTSGRLVPGVAAGVDIGTYLVSGFVGGARTTAYSTNSYGLNILNDFSFGKLLGGQLVGAIGIGGHYNEKVLEIPATETDAATTVKDTDQTIGPAFRIAFEAWSHFYIAFEFSLGLGWGVFGNGWSDEGSFSVGLAL